MRGGARIGGDVARALSVRGVTRGLDVRDAERHKHVYGAAEGAGKQVINSL